MKTEETNNCNCSICIRELEEKHGVHIHTLSFYCPNCGAMQESKPVSRQRFSKKWCQDVVRAKNFLKANSKEGGK